MNAILQHAYARICFNCIPQAQVAELQSELATLSAARARSMVEASEGQRAVARGMQLQRQLQRQLHETADATRDKVRPHLPY